MESGPIAGSAELPPRASAANYKPTPTWHWRGHDWSVSWAGFSVEIAGAYILASSVMGVLTTQPIVDLSTGHAMTWMGHLCLT